MDECVFHDISETKLSKLLKQQVQWSRSTFGNGKRTLGIISHIKKELKEIEAEPNDPDEWLDVVMLALDGYWRSGGAYTCVMYDMEQKLKRNMQRKYPFPTSQDETVEHIDEENHD